MDRLDSGLLATIFSHLNWSEVLSANGVCRKWREAARQTLVAEISVQTQAAGRDLGEIVQVFPRAQSFRIDNHGKNMFVASGEDARVLVDEEEENPDAIDLSPLANFTDLKHLTLCLTHLNGRYPYIFRLQNLQSLNLSYNGSLKWDLGMLSGLPNLQKLVCWKNFHLTGDLQSLRTVKATLVEVSLCCCGLVTGSLEVLYDFPLLKKIVLQYTRVVGDIRTIGNNDLVSLEEFPVGGMVGVYGGGHLYRIEYAPEIMVARHHLITRIPGVFDDPRWGLAYLSPQRYTEIEDGHPPTVLRPPFSVEFVKAGNRIGWRWTNCYEGGACEVHWIDPEPGLESEGYETYKEELARIDSNVDFYKGFFTPPTLAEYHKLVTSTLDDRASRKLSFYCVDNFV